MATQNASITDTWSKIVDSGDSTFLVQARGDTDYEVATVATETNPTVSGHVISGNKSAVTRDTLGEGHVYARVLYGSTATLVVTGSSETLT